MENSAAFGDLAVELQRAALARLRGVDPTPAPDPAIVAMICAAPRPQLQAAARRLVFDAVPQIMRVFGGSTTQAFAMLLDGGLGFAESMVQVHGGIHMQLVLRPSGMSQQQRRRLSAFARSCLLAFGQLYLPDHTMLVGTRKKVLHATYVESTPMPPLSPASANERPSGST